jgi:prepilin-type N-terminal cleavage/methylation domain-containing protein
MKKAFSLIELSIVIVIVGIIIAGVTQSSKLLNKAALISAQTLTKSSPVAGIENLVLWLEPTLNESFGSNSLPDDSSAVASWHDINPQTSFKNNAQQTVSDNKPLFIDNCINSLPCIRFDGVQDATGDMLISDADIGSAIGNTFFIVLQKIGTYASDEFIFGNTLGYFGIAIDGGGFLIATNGGSCTVCGFFLLLCRKRRSDHYLSRS